MRILMLATDYPGFLAQFYTRNPGLDARSFVEQSRALDDAFFNVSEFYIENLRRLGHEAVCLHPNNVFLQRAWAREHGLDAPALVGSGIDTENNGSAWLKRRLRPYKALLAPIANHLGLLGKLGRFEREILLAQVEAFRPDVVHNQDLQGIDSTIMRAIRKPGRMITGQIGVDPPTHIDFKVYDLIVSQIPWVVEYFRSIGVSSERHFLGFESSLVERLGPQPDKDIALSFVGSLTAAHSDRVKFLEAVAERFPIELWVPSLAGIPARSPLHACRKHAVYGREMYNVLRRSKITLNSHIDVARGSATNLRLFEATGVNTFLLTDDLKDLPGLFAPGKELAVYGSIDHCQRQLEYFLSHEQEREEIARNGQGRTLRDHNFELRSRHLLELIGKWKR
jgi:spore maturation protein CgeB